MTKENQDRENPRTHFFHIRNPKMAMLEKMFGKGSVGPVPLIATVAYRIEKQSDGKSYVLAASAKCSRKDNFSRRIGRLVAEGRLNAPKIVPHRFQFEVPLIPTTGKDWRAFDACVRFAVATYEFAAENPSKLIAEEGENWEENIPKHMKAIIEEVLKDQEKETSLSQ